MTQNMTYDMKHLFNISIQLRRFSRRTLIALALLMTGVSGVKGQTYYVFYNQTYGYVYNNNGNLAVSTTFEPLPYGLQAELWVLQIGRSKHIPHHNAI